MPRKLLFRLLVCSTAALGNNSLCERKISSWSTMLTMFMICLMLLMGVNANREDLPEVTCGVNKRCVQPSLCNKSGVREFDPLIDLRADICDGEEVCCAIKDIVNVSNNYENFSCGYRNVNGVGGQTTSNSEGEVEFGEFPWNVAILRKRKTRTFLEIRFHCGGSLIHPRVVLTVAHNVIDKAESEFIVRAGEWEPHRDSEPLPHQDNQVKKIIIPEKFKSLPLEYDGALLILETPFTLAPHIKTICLPDANTISSTGPCFVSGWGTKEFNRANFPQRLKKVDLQVLSTEECNTKLRRTILGRSYTLHDSFICAGGDEFKDACTGDGGSALVCPIPNSGGRYYQAGIVAWGIGCGQKDVPGVYTKVQVFRSWIESVLVTENII